MIGAALLVAWPALARAHSLSFGVLRVSEVEGGASLLLRASGAEGVPPALGLEVGGDGCGIDGEPSRDIEGGVLVVRARVRCFEGARIRVTGLAGSGVRIAVSVVRAGEPEEVAFLDPSNDSYVVGSPAPEPPVFRRYAQLGVEHLALGFDHLLFLLALLLIVFDPRVARDHPRRTLLWTITGFTAGHAVTLSLAILGGVTLPSAPTEVCIALSIVFLAAELIRARRTLVFRRPWLVAAGFGLLHGLGFAGALLALGVRASDAPEALVAFHVGLELAQLAFVTVALGVLWLARGLEEKRRWLAYAIGALATVFSIVRVESLFA